MKVFLGSSVESENLMRTIATWIEAAGHQPVAWDDTFHPGVYTFTNLRRTAREVDAAVFVFSEDDKVWWRTENIEQPRDNVLIEFGLFSAALGDGKVIICRSGKPKTASDLLGITYVDVSDPALARARLQVTKWLSRIQAPDPGTLLLERLSSPFQASGKQSLFLKGTELVRKAKHRVALVAKTPIPLVGTRPYDESSASISYEVEQLEAYSALVERSASGSSPDVICVFSLDEILKDMKFYKGSRFPVRLRENFSKLLTLAGKPKSRVKLRWCGGSATMTFLVCDDDFMIWFKDAFGESVWITATNEVIARALYSHAERVSQEVPAKASLDKAASSFRS